MNANREGLGNLDRERYNLAQTHFKPLCPGQQTSWIRQTMFKRDKKREGPQNSVSVFGSLGLWLLEPGLVTSDSHLNATYGTRSKEGNKVHFESSIPLQQDLSGTTCPFASLTAIVLA